MGKRGGVEGLGVGRGRLGGDNGEREMARGQRDGGDGKGVTGSRRWGRGQRRGGEGGARGGEISQMDYDGMPGWGGHMECLGGMRLQFFLTLFTRATPGTPASVVYK